MIIAIQTPVLCPSKHFHTYGPVISLRQSSRKCVCSQPVSHKIKFISHFPSSVPDLFEQILFLEKEGMNGINHQSTSKHLVLMNQAESKHPFGMLIISALPELNCKNSLSFHNPAFSIKTLLRR